MYIAILWLHYIWCIVFKFNFIVWLTSCMGRCQTYETKVILTNSLQNCCSSTCLHHFSHSPKKSWNVWKHRFPRVAISTSKPTNNWFWELSWTKKETIFILLCTEVHRIYHVKICLLPPMWNVMCELGNGYPTLEKSCGAFKVGIDEWILSLLLVDMNNVICVLTKVYYC